MSVSEQGSRETARSGIHPARGRWDTDAIDAAARQAGGVFDPPQIPFDVVTVPTSDDAAISRRR
ncbi:hypothetical protein ACAG26_09110 [Mycobacterium sp. pUA109]|uniref:hypothetical protein n=1 Tax=Mycobacterium sp. pUA109 TaxID=3238982 RepID=UPI00351B6C34